MGGVGAVQTEAFPLASWPCDCPSGHVILHMGRRGWSVPQGCGASPHGRHAHVPLPADPGTRRPVWGQRECFQQHGLMLQPLGSQELSALPSRAWCSGLALPGSTKRYHG